jgi:protein TonB
LSAALARLGAPLALSLALHALVLAGIAAGEAGPALAERLPAPLVVRLQAPIQFIQPAAAAEPARAPRPAPKRYWKSSEVDERATPVEMAALVYPEVAYMNRLRGTVRMRIYVSGEGRVERAEIVEASPKGHFEKAAIDAVQRTRFRPARKDGRPVASQKLIEVEFDPYGPRPEERS